MKFLYVILFILLAACTIFKVYNLQEIENINTIEKLNNLSEFNFFIFSDNDGNALDNQNFIRMNNFLKTSRAEFAIGLGDHIKKRKYKPFLDLIKNDEWWHNNFYPNIADGENEVFGESQADWGAGNKLFDYINTDNQNFIKFQDNQVEYYAVIPVKDYKIHLIQLHFPDQPQDVRVSFKQESKDFLIQTLNSIKKSKNDIIIVGAHSLSGFWHHLLSKTEQKILYGKADIILSATTHIFDRALDPFKGDNGVMIFNTGSLTDPFLFCPPGYVQVNVLKNPDAIVLQYLDVSKEEYKLATSGLAFIKFRDGKIFTLNFKE